MGLTIRPFKVGTEPPDPSHDKGAGEWCKLDKTGNFRSEPVTREAVTFKKYILNHLPSASVKLGWDAAAHMGHFLGNSGRDYHVNVSEYIKKSRHLKHEYDTELECAKTFAEFFPPGEFSKNLNGDWGDNNLYFAIAKYKFWGQADLKITKLTEKNNECKMKFKFHFLDRYNWDDLKSTNLDTSDPGGNTRLGHPLLPKSGMIKDGQMQALVRQCMGKEFDLKGIIEAEHVFTYEQRQGGARVVE